MRHALSFAYRIHQHRRAYELGEWSSDVVLVDVWQQALCDCLQQFLRAIMQLKTLRIAEANLQHAILALILCLQ